MGRMQAQEMVARVDTDTALRWHLTSNHFPPLPVSMIEPCKRAITKANAGQWNAMVRLPKGVTYRGKTLAPVHAMIEQHHLHAWLDDTDE